ncbi:MAG: DUF2461 domain-containing protein [Chloroflexi bacterium]|nr:MAG: DUF2461 domain-containing protein [Chloroflexota bacterium]
MTEIFNGFPEAGIEFLQQLAENNNREWFEAHKSEYITYLREPAQLFVVALGEKLQAISDGIHYDTRTNGSGSLMRINRDIRFSKDKTPYHTYVTAMFWQGAGKKTEHPAFGFRFSTDEVGLMAGMHHFSKPMLAAYRDAVVDDKLGPALEAAIEKVTQAGEYTIGGEHYKRVPRGYDAEHPRADLLRYAGLHAFTTSFDRAALTSPTLVDVCFEHCRNMSPLFEWLVRVDSSR